MNVHVVFKKKQHEDMFCHVKSKQQLCVHLLSIENTVISLYPLLCSSQIVMCANAYHQIMLHDKRNSDVVVKNEFKEIVVLNFSICKNVKIDVFPTFNARIFLNSPNLLTEDMLIQLHFTPP